MGEFATIEVVVADTANRDSRPSEKLRLQLVPLGSSGDAISSPGRLKRSGTGGFGPQSSAAIRPARNGVGTGADAPSGLVEVMLRGAGIGALKHERSAEMARRTGRPPNT